MFVHRAEVEEVRKEVPVKNVAPSVVSVSAINGGQLLVKFSTEVDKTSAQTESNYALSDGKTVSTATLLDDKKSVRLTLNNAFDNKAAYKVAVTVQNVIIDGTVDTKFPVFTQVITVEDKVNAEISSVKAVTKDDSTKEVEVKFSEPVQTGAAYKINGVSVSNAVLNPAGTTLTLTAASNLETGKTYKIEAINLTDKSGNVNSVATKEFTVTKDAVAPVVQSVVAHGDNALLVTFSKDMKNDAAALANLKANIKVKSDVYEDVTVGSVTQLDGDSETQFVVQLQKTGANSAAGLFSSSKTSHNVTVLFVNDAIEDYLGNKLVGISKSATLTKDTVAPEVTGITYKKNSAGKVTALVVNFSEGVKANASLAFPANVVNENGVVVTSASVFGTIGNANVAEGAKKATFAITSGTEKEVTGKYSFTLTTGFVKDSSIAENESKAYSAVVDFGSSQTSGDYTVTSASTTTTNVITVKFPEAVKGGAVTGSATDPSRYTINGSSLPSGTTITLNAEGSPTATDKAQTIATITVPDGTMNATDGAAIFTVNGVQTLTGKTNKPFTTTVSVTDNIKPELKSAKVLDNKTIELTYNEDMVTLNGAFVGDEFTIYQGSSAVTLADAELVATSVSGFPAKIKIVVTKGADSAGAAASTFATATNLTKGTNTGTGNVTVLGTFTGTANETVTVKKTATGYTVDGTNDVVLTGSTFTYKGLTFSVADADANGVATNDTFTVSLTAYVAATSTTTLDLTKSLSVETKVPAAGGTTADVLDKANNKQKASVKVDVAK
ncbi:hypothetical protein F7731_10405 [Cytobacillus depressus]|uniref:SbsA Ig-like domain-containing protein n=1 Tax=Cytobacillus depressus TaxID=1602942 RepID=A0A6L3V686_9BACI|nr:hypothetical protein [Cytobacillus depressus]KAB2336756.1 hypothetical protein F7731_10405 [Cytobacillus depressus]